jgi:hypothetical protein
MKSVFIAMCIASLSLSGVYAQGIMGKIKQKAGQAAERAIDKKANQVIEKKTGIDLNTPPNGPGGGTTGSDGSSNPSNKTGGGLISTPPNVNENLAEAVASYKTASYGEARYAMQQAMLGVEMEIGNKVLKNLPESVVGLARDAQADQVTSTGWGWVGLTIQRKYSAGDKQLRVTIANNSAWMSAYNAMMSSGGYAQTTNGEQNWKQTKVKGYKGIIEYSDGSGYRLSVPIGQTSLIMWEGINFASEPDMMAAANAFDIDGIKKQLGEK